MSFFELDRAFEQGSFRVGEGPLSQVRLMKDGELPWFILIPQKNHLRELVDLDREDQHLLLDEINLCQKLLLKYTQCDKINLGALGNITAQFHVHIIARYKNDRAWPGPVWGTQSLVEFNEAQVSLWSERFMDEF